MENLKNEIEKLQDTLEVVNHNMCALHKMMMSMPVSNSFREIKAGSPIGISKTTVYEGLIHNVADYIRSDENRNQQIPMTAFVASDVLSVAFCKAKEEIVLDIVSIK